jgi:protoporphyrinogen oxidase
MDPKSDQILIIGAGPAGLTAAYELSRHGHVGVIVESDHVVGGIARTVERDGWRFDIGGHRFFTKVKEIEDLWDEMLGEPMLSRPRMSRIYYGGKFYDYPLRATNALKNMGLFTAGSCMMSYAWVRMRPNREPKNYQEWVTNQFGSKLFNMFFKSYTEKVWGIPCTAIGADWAAQRIKGLSLGEAVRNALFGHKKTGGVVKTLINEFRYPRLGPGQLWENCAATLQQKGWTIRFGTKVVAAQREEARISSVTVRDDSGKTEQLPADHVFSSMPLRSLLKGMTPPPPPTVLQAATALSYRDFLTVVLVIDKEHLFPDNWIYIHAPEVRMGRIQNFKNWSPYMVPDPTKTCLGLEYFVNEGDDLWTLNDDDLVQLGYQELKRINLADGPLVKGYVVRMPKAYPVYDTGYQERLDLIREWLEPIRNLYCIGRNGQHRYNNQDHSMATAIIAARNVALAEDRDPWAVNEDAEYHEISKTEREAPVMPSKFVVGDPNAALTEHVVEDGRLDEQIVQPSPPAAASPPVPPQQQQPRTSSEA